MTPKEVLLRAADLIERDGWCQKAYRRGNQRCITGSLLAQPGMMAGLAAKKIRAHLALGSDLTLVDWNDSLPPETGRATVLAALRGAAESCDK